MSRAPLLAGVVILGVSAGSSTSAHHSLAQFDGTRIVRIEGKVMEFRGALLPRGRRLGSVGGSSELP